MYLNCLNCARTWAACKCDDWTREEALFRAERRDGIRDVEGGLTPKGVAHYARIDALERAAARGWEFGW